MMATSKMQLPAPKQEASSELVEISKEAKEASRFDSSEVIYPPPDLRVIIDKTASFVARVGPRFEAKIREQERGNPKFAFLNEGDPYYAYYRVQSQAAKQGGSGNAPMTAGSAAEEVQAAIQADQSTTQIDTSVPEEPPAHEFSIEFPGVPAVDLDVVKLTALFTARNGPRFASGLAAREARSYQFEFLKPAHPLFSYFNLLVEQYRRVMHPSAQLLKEVQQASQYQAHAIQGPGRGGPRMHILQQIQQRAKWAKWHADREREMAQEEKRMKGLFDEIDWQDFIVVGVVELTDADERAELPAARSRRELQNLAIAQQRMTAMNQEIPAGEWDQGAYEAAASQMHSAIPNTSKTEVHSEAPKQSSVVSAPPPAVPAVDTQQDTPAVNPPASQAAPARSSIQVSTPQGPIKIRHDYQRETRTGKAAAQTTVCPVCSETVPIATMGEHVRVELMNPKFREERQKLEQRKEEQASLAQGADPSRFLREFAGARTDLFGHASDEVARQKREAQAQQLAREKVKHVWDGHLNSATSTQEARQRTAHVDQAIAQLHPTEPSAPTAGPERPTVPQKRAHEADTSGKSTVPKSQPQYIPRKEDGSLYSESEWLSMYPYPVMVQVKLPNSPQISAKCNGRMLRLGSMPLSTTIGTIRDRVLIGPLERTVGASKLKLWIAGKPATLRQTLAYWNFANGDTIDMSISK